MRRLFAVVISVGFAGAIAGSQWVQERRLPVLMETEYLTLLIAGTILVVASWERYHQAVKSDESAPLFFLEITMVLLYLLPLLLYESLISFLVSVAIVYLMYGVWWIVMIAGRFRTPKDALPRLLATGMWLLFFIGVAWRWTHRPPAIWIAGLVLSAAFVLYRWHRTRLPVGTAVSAALLSAVVFLVPGSEG